jgi:RNA polymerase sigma-70 factor (ECF subfamily)
MAGPKAAQGMGGWETGSRNENEPTSGHVGAASVGERVAQQHTSFQQPSEEFVQLFTRTQRRLYLTILAQVPRPDDAEEILQNANVIIWSKYHQFEAGTNFFAWAARIATYEVLKYRQKHARDRLQFSEEFVKSVAVEMADDSPQLDQRRQALARCMNKLRPKDRELIRLRYSDGARGKTVARHIGRPVNSVYQSLGRIRRALLNCVNRQLNATHAESR